MKKIVILLVLIFVMLVGSGLAFAQSSDKPKSPEEIYPEFGFKSVGEAIHDAEQHFNQRINLPTRIPPVAFTHCFARLNDLDGDYNDSFEVKCFHENKSANHYKIDVRPIERKTPIKRRGVSRTFELNSGREARFMDISSFYVLFFETEKWQYQLSIDKRTSDRVTAEDLVKIANTIEE